VNERDVVMVLRPVNPACHLGLFHVLNSVLVESIEMRVGDLVEALSAAAFHKPFTISRAGRVTVYVQPSPVSRI